MEYNPTVTFIYPKDVQRITRKTDRHARWVLDKVRKRLGKESRQPITILEFCNFTGMKVDYVVAFLDAK